MNTRSVLYLSHDPGGYDVIAPLVEKSGTSRSEFFCIGPSAELCPEYAVAEETAFGQIKQGLSEGCFKALVTGTSWGSKAELEAIRLFRLKGLPTIAILDYWSNYTQRFETETKVHLYPDYLVVMDQLAKNEAVQAGVPEGIIQMLGHPGLDKIIKLRASGMSPKLHRKRKVLFLSQPLSRLYGHTLGYTEQDVLEDCLSAAALCNLSLNIKFHPKDEPQFRESYHKFAVNGNLIELFPSYDLVIGMSTMGLLHAVLMGVPAVSYQPNLLVPDEAITNKLGLTTCLTEKQRFIDFIKSYQFGPVENHGNWDLYLWTDGCSTSRVSTFIEGVLAG